jgi:hypothetical protein
MDSLRGRSLARLCASLRRRARGAASVAAFLPCTFAPVVVAPQQAAFVGGQVVVVGLHAPIGDVQEAVRGAAQQVPIVAHQHRAGEFEQRQFQGAAHLQVEVVGRFVQHQHVGALPDQRGPAPGAPSRRRKRVARGISVRSPRKSKPPRKSRIPVPAPRGRGAAGAGGRWRRGPGCRPAAGRSRRCARPRRRSALTAAQRAVRRTGLRRSVVLPAPLRPSRARRSPARRLRSTFCSTGARVAIGERRRAQFEQRVTSGGTGREAKFEGAVLVRFQSLAHARQFLEAALGLPRLAGLVAEAAHEIVDLRPAAVTVSRHAAPAALQGAARADAQNRCSRRGSCSVPVARCAARAAGGVDESRGRGKSAAACPCSASENSCSQRVVSRSRWLVGSSSSSRSDGVISARARARRTRQPPEKSPIARAQQSSSLLKAEAVASAAARVVLHRNRRRRPVPAWLAAAAAVVFPRFFRAVRRQTAASQRYCRRR